MKNISGVIKKFDEEFPHNLYESKNLKTKGLAFNGFIKQFIEQVIRETIESVRVKEISIISRFDKGWNSAAKNQESKISEILK